MARLFPPAERVAAALGLRERPAGGGGLRSGRHRWGGREAAGLVRVCDGSSAGGASWGGPGGRGSWASALPAPQPRPRGAGRGPRERPAGPGPPPAWLPPRPAPAASVELSGLSPQGGRPPTAVVTGVGAAQLPSPGGSELLLETQHRGAPRPGSASSRWSRDAHRPGPGTGLTAFRARPRSFPLRPVKGLPARRGSWRWASCIAVQ